MENKQYYLSKVIQFLLIGGTCAGLGLAIPWQPLIAAGLLAVLGALIYARLVMKDYNKILVLIILIIPFNFEGLISMIGIPFVNPFNILWLSYVGVVVFRSVTYSEPVLVKSPLNLPIFLLILSFTLSFIHARWVVDSSAFIGHIFPTYQQWVQWILFYFFCLKGIRDEQEARKVITWVMIMVLFAGMLNIKDYIGMLAATSGSQLERASGLFNNANYSASFFCYYTPVAVGLALANLERPKEKLLYTAAAGTGLMAIVVTYSRGGMAAAALACMVIAVFSKINPRMVIAILLIVGLAASSENIRKRFGETSKPGVYGETLDPSVQARMIAWQKAFHLIKQAPVIGHGFFTFRYIKVEKYEDDAARAHGHHGMAVHNGFINIMVNSGLTGLLLFIFLVGRALKMTWKVFRESPDRFWKGAGLGLFAGIICLLIVNMTGTRLYDRQMVGYLWILLGALYQGSKFSKEKNQLKG